AGSRVFSTIFGGTNNDAAIGVALDAANNVVVAGYTKSFNFINFATNTPGLYASIGVTNGLNADAFVVKISSDGSNLLNSAVFGGLSDDAAVGVTVDPLGDVSVVGYTLSANFPTNGANGYLRNFNSGGYDAFVTTLNPSLSVPLYSVY